jgi:hypothetical protein
MISIDASLAIERLFAPQAGTDTMFTRTLLALSIVATPIVAVAGSSTFQSSGLDGLSQASPMPKVASNDRRNVNRAERRCQAVGPRNVRVCVRKPRAKARPDSELSTSDGDT